MKIHAPWTENQVAALNGWQQRLDVHSFTCGNDSRHAVLVATPDGWRCVECAYQQLWAHAFMAGAPEPQEKL